MGVEDGKFHPKHGSFHVLDKTVDAADGGLNQKDDALAVLVGWLNAVDGTVHQKQGMLDTKELCVSFLNTSYGSIAG